jgi:hypothetical protein
LSVRWRNIREKGGDVALKEGKSGNKERECGSSMRGMHAAGMDMLPRKEVGQNKKEKSYE